MLILAAAILWSVGVAVSHLDPSRTTTLPIMSTYGLAILVGVGGLVLIVAGIGEDATGPPAPPRPAFRATAMQMSCSRPGQ